MSDVLRVDIWSDVQCPWCYIGKRRFEAALDQFDGEVEVVYHSFELAPDVPLDFTGTTIDYLTERKGMSRSQVATMLDRVSGIAANVGLEYHFERVHQVNTVRAHEAIHHAKNRGLQQPMVERLFRAYFTEGRNLADVDTLVELAEDVGLDGSALRHSLDEREHLNAVKDDVAQAARFGIQGVPFFVIGGKYGVSGAQEPQLLLSALQEAAAELA